jgi:hypothetical protein
MDGDKPRINVLINPLMFSLTLAAPDYKELLPRLNVPFIQAMLSLNPYAQWRDSLQGMHTMDVSYSAAQPEFDGALITVAVATREHNLDRSRGLAGQAEAHSGTVGKDDPLAQNWARLHKSPTRNAVLSVIFSSYPPRNDRKACRACTASPRKHLLDRKQPKVRPRTKPTGRVRKCPGNIDAANGRPGKADARPDGGPGRKPSRTRTHPAVAKKLCPSRSARRMTSDGARFRWN